LKKAEASLQCLYYTITVLNLLFSLLLLLTPTVSAQDSSWQIRSFHSDIVINQDTSIIVKETIETDFGYLEKHGIFRDIPYLYTVDGKSVKTDIKVKSITDENGIPYKYTSSRHNQSLELKIGDANQTISGEHTYVINYSLEGTIQKYEDTPELYWNVTGNEWEVPILHASASVESPHAKLIGAKCYQGPVGSIKLCNSSTQANEASFVSNEILPAGQGITIATKLDTNNNLIFPSQLEKTTDFLISNYGYLIAPLPVLIMIFFWWKRGRDRAYLSEVYYYKPDNKAEKLAPIFPRLSLPLTYSPINGLTPSEVGTLIDEKVNIEDLIAEIVELARLGYIKIHKKDKKGLFKKMEFSLEKIKKATNNLEPHQLFLLTKLFSGTKEGEIVSISNLSNNFYLALPKIKNKIYEQLQDKDIFNSSPEKTKGMWIGIYVLMQFIAGFFIFSNAVAYFNFFPLIFLVILSPIGLIFALSMPRRTAWGHSLFLQTKALREYLKLGKWREEIGEKHLFLDEILPLAISLGVVNKLAKEMDKLGVKPPTYMQGMSTGNFAAQFAILHSSLNKNIAANPHGAGGFSTSGRSSWSGGSGFSGGSSGGGFGGGGGGSW